ncbi:MAG TPA: prepilin-type N-terminal cleavage/methylation domain-containing protein, partial [Gemmataceae bacterium]
MGFRPPPDSLSGRPTGEHPISPRPSLSVPCECLVGTRENSPPLAGRRRASSPLDTAAPRPVTTRYWRSVMATTLPRPVLRVGGIPRPAFTLIELLVVMAIIAVLIGLL